MFVYHIFMTSRFSFLLVVSLYKEDYLQIFKRVLLITRPLRLVGRLSARLTTPIAWILSVTSAIDRPKSVPQLPYNRMCISYFNI